MARFRIVPALGLLLVAILALLVLAIFTIHRDPKRAVEVWATHALRHPVTFGRVDITLSNPLQIELENMRMANEEWGSEPDMAHIGHLTAELDFWPLLKGKIKFLHVILDNSTLLLERNSDGVGNWKDQDAHHPSSSEAKASNSRSKFPTVFDLALHNSEIRFHTSGGAILKITLKDLGLQTEAEDQPVTLKVDGAYNDIPVHMDIKADSFDVLHNPKLPFGAAVSAEGATTFVILNANMLDPLNFDQVNGNLKVSVKKIGNMAALFGEPFIWNVPLNFESTLERHGDVWKLEEAKGNLVDNIFNESRMELTEGKRAEADAIRLALNFDNINVISLLPSKEQKSSASSDPKLTFLNIADKPSLYVDALMSAKAIVYDALKAVNVKVQASVTDGAVALDDISMGIFGGKMHAFIISKASGKNNIITTKAELVSIDIKQVLQALHINNENLNGQLNAGLTAGAIGETTEQLKRTAQGYVGLSMVNGQVSRQLVRLASTDVRAFFNKDKSYTPIACMVAIFNFREGVGTLAPFKMKTDSGTLVGGGVLDLPLKTIDLTFQTDPQSTSALALDVPVHVIGKIDSPYVGPKLSSPNKINLSQSLPRQQLPHWLLGMNAGNPCYGG